MQAPMTAITIWPMAPPAVVPKIARASQLPSSAPTIPRMMFISRPWSDFMIFSAIHPAIAPRMIDRIQPKPSMHFPFSKCRRNRAGDVSARSMRDVALAFPQAAEIAAIRQTDRQTYFISR